MSAILPHVADHIPERIKNDPEKVRHFILGFTSGPSHQLFGIDTAYSEEISTLPEPQKNWASCVLWGAAVRKEISRDDEPLDEGAEEVDVEEIENDEDLVSHYGRLQSGCYAFSEEEEPEDDPWTP